MRDMAAVYYDNHSAVDLRQLCVQEKSTTDDTLDFVLCQQKRVEQIGTWLHFANCLRPLSHWQQIVRCVATDEGKKLLRKSAEYSEQHNAKTSLTFQLNGSQRCVFDQGAWRQYDEDCPGGYSVPMFSKSIKSLSVSK
ncbi:hypothetical protein EC988_004653 [Linderina pennispora]|nr:hypothetical protein EC988_004653 [Linderina pennispora]